MDENTVVSFLKELTELTHKYKIAIETCGSCGEPMLCDMEDDEKKYKYSVRRESLCGEFTNLNYTYPDLADIY